MSVLPVSQNKRRALYRNVMVGLIALVGMLTFASRAFGFDAHLILAFLLLPILVLAPLQFGAMDEAAKQAHISAWYWGCTAAVVAIGVLAIGLTQNLIPFGAVASVTAHWIGGAREPSLFVAGLLFGPLMMIGGYLIFSVIYWFRTR
ncbi:MAG: hypothetical protein KF779_13520 [Hyphomonadaceae bacterium]|nr:hypothetical protein [Hyphomonadaceae bacterium]